VLEAVKIRFPLAKVIGYEKSRRPYEDALRRREKNGLDYEIYYKDFFGSDISEARIIYSYMITYMMEKIWKKVNKECKK
jgi:hypothetical protein